MALTKSRNTVARQPEFRRFPVNSGASIHAGGIVLNHQGNAMQGMAIAGAVALGRAQESVDNTYGQSGDAFVSVSTGCFAYANSATDPVTRSMIGRPVYVEDDETVSGTDAGMRCQAGICFDIDEAGVWVIFT